MGTFQQLAVIFTSILTITVSGQQPPLMNSTVIEGSVCEPLTVPLCLDRGVQYSQTIFPNLAGMMAQGDAEQATTSFAPLAPICPSIVDFVCIMFAPPCLEVNGYSVPVPPCRHVCEAAQAECSPYLQAAGVPWPEQFECSKFSAIREDGPVTCAEPEMRVLSALSEVAPQPEPEPEPEPAGNCYEVTVPECAQMGFTHTTFPNIFGHTTPDEMAQEMGSLTSLIVSGCSADILPLVCGAYLPKCVPETGEVTNPCKETCRRVSKDCKDTVKELDLGRVEIFSCRQYPSKKDGMCVEDVRAPAPPVILNITRSAVSQATLHYLQPDTADVSFNGIEVTFFNVKGDDEGTVFVDTPDTATIDVMTQSAYTVLVRSVNDWGMSLYVDATVPEYTEGYEFCETMTFPICNDFKYQSAQFPNLLGHMTAIDAGMELSQFAPLVQVQCSPKLSPFLCSLYAPKCTGIPGPQGIVPPCRELCLAARGGCEGLMNKFGFSWPETMDCNVFPAASEVGRNCFNDDELTLKPLVNTMGRIETDLGSPASTYCSSATPDARPQWLSPAGEVVMTKATGEETGVYTEHIGSMTAALMVKSLSTDNSGVYTCQLGQENQTMVISPPKSCLPIEQEECKLVLAYDDSQYPNSLGHLNPIEAELSTYSFLPLLALQCSVQNLPIFVCSLVYSRCEDDVPMGPCAELCTAAMTECSPFILGAQFAWPDYAQCSRFPPASSGKCVPPHDYVGPEPSAVPMPEPEGSASPSMNETTMMNTKTPMTNETASGELRHRSYAVTDRGMVQLFRGWVDVQGQGAPNDFCRVVRTTGKPFLSCLLAGAEEDDLLSYTSPNPSMEWFDPGYSHTWYMRDEDGDGRDDYCRCVGSVPSTVVVCMKAGVSGFEGPSSDFVPPNAPDECLFKQADPFFGF